MILSKGCVYFMVVFLILATLTGCKSKPFGVKSGTELFALEYNIKTSQTMKQLVALTRNKIIQYSTAPGRDTTPERRLLENTQAMIDDWNTRDKNYYQSMKSIWTNGFYTPVVTAGMRLGLIDSSGNSLTNEGKASNELDVLVFSGQSYLQAITAVRFLNVSKIKVDSDNHLTIGLQYTWAATALGNELNSQNPGSVKIIDLGSGTAGITVNEKDEWNVDFVKLHEVNH